MAQPRGHGLAHDRRSAQPPGSDATPGRAAVAIGFFFLSGAAGLIYEVCWIRRASLVFGSTTYALSSVLAIFFLGLACGSYLFGRLSERTARPLRPRIETTSTTRTRRSVDTSFWRSC